MNKVIKVQPLTQGFLQIQLADGREGKFDVNPYMCSDFFSELKNPEVFNKVTVFFSGVGWPGGQDLSPDTIAIQLLEHKDGGMAQSSY